MEGEEMKDDGGQAFPFMPYHYPDELVLVERGMSLRDWFAGMALVGVTENYWSSEVDAIVSKSYEIADAMLKEKEK
jgi:hypothetical protein